MKLGLIYNLKKVTMLLVKELKRRRKSIMLSPRKAILLRSPRRRSYLRYAKKNTPSSSAHISASSVGAKDTNLRRVGLNFQKKPLDTYMLLGRTPQLFRRTQRTPGRGRTGDLNLLDLTGVLILRLQGVKQRLLVAG